MPSRILADRTHLDKQVLAGCPENQAIPLEKLHLAPRVGNKIFRPQKAAYMINNLPISESEKESFLLDFVERSIKSRPILPQAVQYNSRSVDTKSNRPNVSQSMYDTLLQQFGQSQLNVTQAQEALMTSQKQLRLQQYTTTFVGTTVQKQKQTLMKLYDNMDSDERTRLANKFGVSSKDELEKRLKQMGKQPLIVQTMQHVEDMINDDSSPHDLDDYFSESAISSLVS